MQSKYQFKNREMTYADIFPFPKKYKSFQKSHIFAITLEEWSHDYE